LRGLRKVVPSNCVIVQRDGHQGYDFVDKTRALAKIAAGEPIIILTNEPVGDLCQLHHYDEIIACGTFQEILRRVNREYRHLYLNDRDSLDIVDGVSGRSASFVIFTN
jgi:hypothetical protein